ncbi:hypothetical protein MFM001_42520 [Mycobacterium sp. MFM001]|nr:hypothetical protein MFM001_42520 [Mycobacterium sp. MFM001]
MYWFFTWICGALFYLLLLIIAHLTVFYACERIADAIVKVRVIADQGATLEQRRRNACWLIRVDRWRRVVKSRTWVHYGFGDEPNRTERLTRGTRRSAVSRFLIGVGFGVGEVANSAKTAVLSWLGALSALAATWVVYESQVRHAWAAIAAWLDNLDLPQLALAFTIVTFFVVNAVNWRRRGLSKWRSDHSSGAYADLARIRVIVLGALKVISPALTAWHSSMARSWDIAASPARMCPSLVGPPYRGPWRSQFDCAHKACEDALRDIEAITGDPDRRDGIWAAVPWYVRGPLFLPADYLELKMFAPAVHQRVDEFLAGATDRQRLYCQIVEAAASAAAHQAQAALHQHLDRPVLELLAGGEDDPPNRYPEVVEAAASAAAHQAQAALHENLDRPVLELLAAGEDQAPQHYREILDSAASAAAGRIQAAVHQNVDERCLRQLHRGDQKTHEELWAPLGLSDDPPQRPE